MVYDCMGNWILTSYNHVLAACRTSASSPQHVQPRWNRPWRQCQAWRAGTARTKSVTRCEIVTFIQNLQECAVFCADKSCLLKSMLTYLLGSSWIHVFNMFSTFTAFLMSRYGLMKDRFKSAGDFFKVLDVNGDGVLQHEEFQRSMKKVFKGEQQGFLGDCSDVHWVSTKKALESSWIFCGIQIIIAIMISKKSEVLVYHEISWNVIQWHGMSFNIMKRREMSWNHETFRFAFLQPWFPLSFSMDLKWCYKSTSRCQASESTEACLQKWSRLLRVLRDFSWYQQNTTFFRSFSKVSSDVHLDCSYLFARAGFLLVASLRCESCLRIPWIDFNRIKTSTQCLMNLCWWIFSASTFMWHASIPERHVLARRRSKTLQCSRHLGPWKCHIAGQRQRERDWETFRCPFRTLKQIETYIENCSNRLEHI